MTFAVWKWPSKCISDKQFDQYLLDYTDDRQRTSRICERGGHRVGFVRSELGAKLGIAVYTASRTVRAWKETVVVLVAEAQTDDHR